MNSKKYENILYRMRYIYDLRDLVHSSAEIFAECRAFLVKDGPGSEYRPISYRQFEKEIDFLGTKLVNLGLKGKKIALIGENSYKWVVSYLAVTNGTGVIVPLDKELPDIEIKNLLDRAKVDAIIFSDKMKERVYNALEGTDSVKIKINMNGKEPEQGVLAWEDLILDGKELLNEGNRDFISTVIDRETMCTLIFTSGTTGLAKGVMLSHKNIAANVYNMSKYVKIREPGCGLSVLPMHHTYEFTCHILTGLYQGMAIAICEGLKYIQQNLKESRATVMLGVPAVFEAMHRKIWKQAESKGQAVKMRRMMKLSRQTRLFNNQKAIRKVFQKVHNSIGNNMALFIAGGAAINPQVIRDYEALGIPMIQGYGMTECAPIIAVNRDYYSKAHSVGKPLPGTTVKIVDKDEEGVGEIVCAGPSVMIGYYDDPIETAKVIRDGWLYTGDYGWMDKDGFLYICGRKKNVIVTKNGKNIFPEEIEYLLEKNTFIKEVVVYGVFDEDKRDIIVKAEVYPNFDEIRKSLGEVVEENIREVIKNAIEEVNNQMPLYKRVKRFKLRDVEFDKTTTQKIKRTANAIREE